MSQNTSAVVGIAAGTSPDPSLGPNRSRRKMHHADLSALVEHLVAGALGPRCELTDDQGRDRCPNPAVGIRWEDGFADDVCEKHAASAEHRDALVIRPTA